MVKSKCSFMFCAGLHFVFHFISFICPRGWNGFISESRGGVHCIVHVTQLKPDLNCPDGASIQPPLKPLNPCQVPKKTKGFLCQKYFCLTLHYIFGVVRKYFFLVFKGGWVAVRPKQQKLFWNRSHLILTTNSTTAVDLSKKEMQL